MKKPLSAVNVFAILLGIFLVVEGFWGMFSPIVFGVLTTNVLHAFIHLLLGFTGIYTGLRNHARKFSLYAGVLLLVVGLLYYIPGAGQLVVKLFNVNNAVAVLNIVIGIAGILFALLTPKPAVAGAHK
ncbi:MAG: DUF4383 domain-containing protein [Ferruginibacter sp.]|nr:DUF4383 domain-containing protein [Ferruginibacter sp.]